MVDLTMTIFAGSVCGVTGGIFAALSSWLMVDEWRWRKLHHHAGHMARAVGLMVVGLTFWTLATLLAWEAVFR